MPKNILLAIVLIFCFQQVATTSDSHQVVSKKYKIEIGYFYPKQSRRKVEVITKTLRTIPGDGKKVSLCDKYTIRFSETFDCKSKSKFTAKLHFEKIEQVKTKDDIETLNIDTSVDQNTDANLETKIANGAINNGIDYELLSTGKINKITNLKNFPKNVVKKSFSTASKSKKTKEAYDLIEKKFPETYFPELLEDLYVVFPKTSLKIGSTWESNVTKTIKNIGKIRFEVEYKIISITKVEKQYFAEINFSSSKDSLSKSSKINKDVRLSSMDLHGSLTFNISQSFPVKSNRTFSILYKQKIRAKNGGKSKIEKLKYEKSTDVLFDNSVITTNNPIVKIETNMGEIIVELYEDETPNAVANFIELCENRFYDDFRFHRVVRNVMFQCG